MLVKFVVAIVKTANQEQHDATPIISAKMNELFGDIDIDNLNDCYEADIQIDGSNKEIDLNFESTSIEKSMLKNTSNVISNIDNMAQQAFTAISEDYDLGEESETARDYLEHHLDVLPKEDLLSIFGNTEVSKELFMNALSLYRIGLFPEDDESFAIFDVQFSRDVTNYLMAVTFDSSGKLSYISMDS